jgi:mxaK protein
VFWTRGNGVAHPAGIQAPGNSLVNKAPPIRTILAFLAGGIALAIFSAAIWQYRQASLIGEAIETLLSGHDIGPERRFGAPAKVRLAYAVYLIGREDYRGAEQLLAELGQSADAEVADQALYNLGNVYLRRAIAAVEQDQPTQAGTLAELAKQAYRRALRIRPEHWSAKYNYEVAARLMPDFDRIDVQGEDSPEEEASPRKLWTRVPGIPRGLP